MPDGVSFSFGVHCSENELSGVLKVSEQHGSVPRVKYMTSFGVCVLRGWVFFEGGVFDLFQGSKNDHCVNCVSTLTKWSKV
jgi:hypothetical protein